MTESRFHPDAAAIHRVLDRVEAHGIREEHVRAGVWLAEHLCRAYAPDVRTLAILDFRSGGAMICRECPADQLERMTAELLLQAQAEQATRERGLH